MRKLKISQQELDDMEEEDYRAKATILRREVKLREKEGTEETE